MRRAIRCGMLGVGHAHATGKLHVLRHSPDYELVGVCEPDAAARLEAQGTEAFAGVRWLSQQELLGDPSVEMIAVESDVPHLLELGHAAVRAGKHIHLDKPAGTSLPDFRALLDEADRRDLIVQMGYMFRYNAGFDFVRRTIREGWLGRVHYVHGSIPTDPPRAIRRKLAFHPGGMMFELACHLIDMVVLLFGRPDRVTPFLRHDGEPDDGLADNTLVVLEYERTLVVLESSCLETNPFPRRKFEVCGGKGTVVIQPLEPAAVCLCLREPAADFQAGWQTVSVPDVPRYVRDLEELAECIRGEREFPYTKEHDFVVQETILRSSGERA